MKPSAERLAELTLAVCRAVAGVREPPRRYVFELRETISSEEEARAFLSVEPKPLEILASLRGPDIVIRHEPVTEPGVLAYLSRRERETLAYLRNGGGNSIHYADDAPMLVRMGSYSEVVSLRDYCVWLGVYHVRNMSASISSRSSDPEASRIGAAYVAELSPSDPSASLKAWRFRIS